jgi:hypothetical protein
LPRSSENSDTSEEMAEGSIISLAAHAEVV